MAEAVRKHMPQLYKIFELLYSKPSELVTRDGKVVASIATGGRQGDNLMSLFFCLALKDPLAKVAAAYPGVALHFYIDDGNIEGEYDAVMPAVHMLASELAKMGLNFHGEKSKFFCGTADDWGRPTMGEQHVRDADDALGLVELKLTRAEGVMILGAPVGTEEYVREAVSATVERQSGVLKLVHHLPPDVAVAVVHTAVNQRPMQLTRQMDPDVMERPLHIFDTSVDACLSLVLLLGTAALPLTARVLRGLPVYMSGLGIPRLGVISKCAYTACTVQAMVALEQRSQLLSSRIRAFTAVLSDRQIRWFTDILPICKVTTRTAAGVEEVQFKPPFTGDGVIAAAVEIPAAVDVDPQHPQRHNRQAPVAYGQRVLTHKAYVEAHEDLLDTLRRDDQFAQAAMVLSTEPLRPLHSWVLSALSPSPHLRLSRVDYVDAVRHRLLLPDFDGNNGERRFCGCRQLRIDRPEHQLHLMACVASAKARLGAHNQLRDATADFAGVVVGTKNVRVEQKLTPEGRPAIDMDIVITMPDGQQLLVDVGHTLPAGRLAVPSPHGAKTGAAYVRRCAAAAYEDHKRARARQSLSALALGRFHPMIFETSGCMGEAAARLMRILTDTDVHPVACNDRVARARRFYLRKVGTILARGMARCIQAVRADSTAAQFTEEDWAALAKLDKDKYAALPHDFEGGEGPAEPAAGADAGQEVQLPAGGEGGGGDF